MLTPHCDESVFNTDMWLSQKHCFNGRRCPTVPCKSHRGHTFHFYLYKVSELNTQVLARAKRAQVLVDPYRYNVMGGERRHYMYMKKTHEKCVFVLLCT